MKKTLSRVLACLCSLSTTSTALADEKQLGAKRSRSHDVRRAVRRPRLTFSNSKKSIPDLKPFPKVDKPNYLLIPGKSVLSTGDGVTFGVSGAALGSFFTWLLTYMSMKRKGPVVPLTEVSTAASITPLNNLQEANKRIVTLTQQLDQVLMSSGALATRFFDVACAFGFVTTTQALDKENKKLQKDFEFFQYYALLLGSVSTLKWKVANNKVTCPTFNQQSETAIAVASLTYTFDTTNDQIKLSGIEGAGSHYTQWLIQNFKNISTINGKIENTQAFAHSASLILAEGLLRSYMIYVTNNDINLVDRICQCKGGICVQTLSRVIECEFGN